MENRIVIAPRIRHGKPIIKGTRVPVHIVLGALAGGMTYEEVMQEYDITCEDILAAIEYATVAIDTEEVLPLGFLSTSRYGSSEAEVKRGGRACSYPGAILGGDFHGQDHDH